MSSPISSEVFVTSSDDEEEDIDSPELKGYLHKWTNYIHGWQQRFIVLKDSTLSYYKSAEDSDFGCRGAISLKKATIKCHEIDDCRFDISVNNLIWYLRAENPEDKNNWVEVLQSYNIENTTSNEQLSQLKRHGSTVSIQSNTTTLSGSSLKQNSRNLREKLHEITTYRDILFEQVDTLQKYFDACAGSSQALDPKLSEGIRVIDFKGEAITFRETTVAVLTTLQHCVDIIVQREEGVKRKLDKESEKRKTLEEQLSTCRQELAKSRTSAIIGPDLLEEGPNSTIPEDEFFDAVETGLDKIEEVRQIRVKLKLQNQQSQIESGQIVQDDFEAPEPNGFGKFAKSHHLWPEIEQVCEEQLHHALKGVGDDNSGWQLFADEGELKMYRREEEIDGLVMDPLKSCHVVKGCTALEMCHYFFDPQYRNDWETTLEDVQILEQIAPDTLVFLQTHKRIWPANQRDALFWSHMRRIDKGLEEGAKDAWIVCNHSTRNPNYPAANQGKCIRIYLTVILLCQTFVRPIENGAKLTRDDLTCKITYCSVVNPGGWAPATVLRAIYKKEYPKFLKRFTGYVLDQSKNKPIKF